MPEQIVEAGTQVSIAPSVRRGERMGKLMFSLRKEYLHTITIEAKSRGITVQELLRAVIIPDWVNERSDRNEALPNRRAFRKLVFEQRH